MGAPDPIPLFGLGVQEKSRPAVAQSRINLYYELQQDADRAAMVAYGTPGLELFTTFAGVGPTRGFIAPPTSSFGFFVHLNTFYQVEPNASQTALGTILTSSGKVSMFENGRYIMILDGLAGYYYDMAGGGTVTQISDPLFPNGALTGDWSDGYFIAGLGGAFYPSAPNNPATGWGDFATAESSPDNLIKLIADHQELPLFGGQSIEFWSNTGNPDFPYERIPGAAVEWGLAARDSVAKFDDSIAFLAQNQLGQVIAAKLQGYRIQRLSNHDLEARWKRLGSISAASAYSYMLDGHPFYVVNVGGETWMYDGSTNAWSQLVSHGSTRHRAELHQSFNGGNYVTDFENGNVYRLRHDVYTDNGDPIRRVLAGRHVFDGFRRIAIDRFQLDIEQGVGLDSGQGENPQAMLRVSRDGGRTWGPERWTSFGRVGEFKKRAMWGSCGRARDFVFEVSISDPVKVAILGAGIKPRMGSS